VRQRSAVDVPVMPAGAADSRRRERGASAHDSAPATRLGRKAILRSTIFPELPDTLHLYVAISTAARHARNCCARTCPGFGQQPGGRFACLTAGGHSRRERR